MYGAEYSLSQDCFNIDKIETIIKINKLNIKNKELDYKLIGLFNTIEEASDYCDKVREKIGYINNQEE